MAPALVTAQSSARPSAGEWADRVMSVRSVVGGEGPIWSPDGKQIVFASSLMGGGLWSVAPEGGFPRRLAQDIGGAGHFLASQQVSWSPKGDRLAYVSDKGGTTEVWLWHVADGREVRLTNLGARVNSMAWSPDGQSIAFASDRFGNYDVWKIAVRGGVPERLTTDTLHEGFPAWTPDGQSILYVQLDGRWMNHDVIAMRSDGQARRRVVSDTDFFDYGSGETFGYPLISPDGKRVAFRSQRSGWINYWTVPIEGGAPTRIAAASADQSEARWSPDGTRIAYVENHNGTNDLRIVPAAGGAPQVLVAPAMGVVANPDWSPDGTRVSYTFASPTAAADVFVVPVAGGNPVQLTTSTPPGNVERDLVTPRKITYKTFDGTVINAYLYAPREVQPGQRFPGILFIHGGPTAQFNDTFQQQVQFFVRMGYVLLLPNVRGSSGYGRAFEKANNKDWGHGDLKDVLAGVDYLKALPYVNAAKMGITGTSYGGFLTPAAAVWAPGVFQAAIAASGYPDRVKFVQEGEIRHIKQLDYEFGPYKGNEHVYRRNSPFYWIKDIRTPMFLLNGEGKFPGSPQMKDFAAEMERQYKPFQYKAYPGENYYVRSPANTRRMLQDMLEFFDRYLKDDAVRTAASAGDGDTARIPKRASAGRDASQP
jgi:dipeptidyl aminopeptidase/acylaminoacyl peptidase